MGMTKESCVKAYELVCRYQADRKDRTISTELVKICFPAIRQTSNGWRDTPEMAREDVDQELAIFLLEIASKFPVGTRDDFVQYFVKAAKSKVKHFYSEKTGIPVPHTTADENRAKGINLKPSQESYEAILDSVAEDGSGASKLKDGKSPDPVVDFLKNEARRALARYVEALSEDERMFVEMYLDGETPQEMADDFGETDYTMYRRVNSALEAIKRGLESEGFTADDFNAA